MSLAKEYSQTEFVRLESRKIVQQFTIIIMVERVREYPLCPGAFDQVLVKKQMMLCVFLFGHPQQ